MAVIGWNNRNVNVDEKTVTETGKDLKINNMNGKMEPTVNVNEVSRVSAGTVIKGEIFSPNDIRIDGTFEGRIYSKNKVVVGEKAVITGDIICTNLDFWGKIKGNFYVKDTLSLKDTGNVEGDVHIRRLQVDLDSKFNGNCKMITEAEFDKLVESLAPEYAANKKPVVNPTTSVNPQAARPVNPVQNPVNQSAPKTQNFINSSNN